MNRSNRALDHAEFTHKRECSVQRADNTDSFLPACLLLFDIPLRIGGGKVFCMLPTSLGGLASIAVTDTVIEQCSGGGGRRAGIGIGFSSYCSSSLPPSLRYKLLPLPPSKCMEIWRRRRESP